MRYLAPYLKEELKEKMVFVSGPRQCGKTTLVKQLAKDYDHSVYLNYDHDKDKKIILKQQWDPDSDLIIFDGNSQICKMEKFSEGHL